MGFGDSVDDEGWHEGRRYALARLLQARGHAHAAAIVAVSHYRSDMSWNEDDVAIVTLAVPPELYDVTRRKFDEVITEACFDVVDNAQHVNVTYRVMSAPCPTEWIETIVRSLDRKWVPSERLGADEIAGAS